VDVRHVSARPKVERGTVLTVVSVLLLRAGELNSKRVSVVTVPSLVMVSATLAS
jgi:hypothetical protein